MEESSERNDLNPLDMDILVDAQAALSRALVRIWSRMIMELP